MIIQSLQFPNLNLCSEEEMYFRRKNDRTALDLKRHEITFKINGRVSFDTYFNSFSIEKWMRYTILDSVSLQIETKGIFRLTIFNIEKNGISISKKELVIQTISSNSQFKTTIKIGDVGKSGIYTFLLEALSDDAIYYGGAYISEIVINTLPQIELALDICTYHKEEYLLRNIELLKNSILENPLSPLYNHLMVFIVDNGQTLNKKTIETKNIFLYTQGDFGASGGFTRGILEILNKKEELNLTHLIIMDDDVLYNQNLLEMTYMWLRLLKVEYQHSFLGGANFRLDQRFLQSEAGALWNYGRPIAAKCGRDMRQLTNVLDNEVEVPIDYCAFCYLCLPLSEVSEQTLPMPMFMKRDDQDFCLRNCKKMITLNGISVWHESVDYKYYSALEYYILRNRCIINARYYGKYPESLYKDYVKPKLWATLCRYRYKDAHLICKAIEDFCKGVDWFKTLDGELSFEELNAKGYHKSPLDQLSIKYSEKALRASIDYGKKLQRTRKCNITRNGWLFPSKYTRVLPMFNPPVSALYRAKYVLYVDKDLKNGYITKKSYLGLISVICHIAKMRLVLVISYNKAVREFATRYPEFTNKDYWNSYLKIK